MPGLFGLKIAQAFQILNSGRCARQRPAQKKSPCIFIQGLTFLFIQWQVACDGVTDVQPREGLN